MKETSDIDPYGKLRKISMKQLKDIVAGCRIHHEKGKKAPREYLVGLVERCISTLNIGTRFVTGDYHKAICATSNIYIDPDEARKKADTDGLARCYGWGSRYDSWYINYSFIAGDHEYAFSWETYYDEIHRAYSGETVWYDTLGDGTYFTIRYCKKDPRHHYVTAKDYEKLSRPFFVGKRKFEVRKGDRPKAREDPKAGAKKRRSGKKGSQGQRCRRGPST